MKAEGRGRETAAQRLQDPQGDVPEDFLRAGEQQWAEVTRCQPPSSAQTRSQGKDAGARDGGRREARDVEDGKLPIKGICGAAEEEGGAGSGPERKDHQPRARDAERGTRPAAREAEGQHHCDTGPRPRSETASTAGGSNGTAFTQVTGNPASTLGKAAVPCRQMYAHRAAKLPHSRCSPKSSARARHQPMGTQTSLAEAPRRLSTTV